MMVKLKTGEIEDQNQSQGSGAYDHFENYPITMILHDDELSHLIIDHCENVCNMLSMALVLQLLKKLI